MRKVKVICEKSTYTGEFEQRIEKTLSELDSMEHHQVCDTKYTVSDHWLVGVIEYVVPTEEEIELMIQRKAEEDKVRTKLLLEHDTLSDEEKTLYLKECGHDSIEDARASLELVKGEVEVDDSAQGVVDPNAVTDASPEGERVLATA